MAQTIRAGNESVGNITLAVSTTGNDSDSTRPKKIVGGDWSAKPFATIQAAIDALPKILKHLVSVNVAAGSYVGFGIGGFDCSGWDGGYYTNVVITGTRTQAVPATGPATGTATGGSTKTLVLTGAGWTVDDLAGRFVYISSGTGAGNIILIASNTSDTITFAGTAIAAAGSVFEIQDVATIVNTPIAELGGSTFVRATNNVGGMKILDIKAAGSSSSSEYGFVVSDTRISLGRCIASNVGTGFFINGSVSVPLSSCASINCAGDGFFIVQCMFCNFLRCLAKSCINGLQLNGMTWMYSTVGFTILNSSLSAIYSRDVLYWDCRSIVLDGSGTGILGENSVVDLTSASISNCSASPFSLVGCRIRAKTALSGSGNTGFGLNASGSGNIVEIAGFTPTISGVSGDFTVDGTTPLEWGDYVTGDSVVDEATGARISFT